MWPLTSVCVRLGLVPRIDTRSFSEKPPSPPADDAMLTPGTRCSASATFLSGSLPTSSAVITSTTESALRFLASEASSDARRPVTSTCCTSSRAAAEAAGAGASAWAKTCVGAIALTRARAAAAAIGCRWSFIGPLSIKSNELI